MSSATYNKTASDGCKLPNSARFRRKLFGCSRGIKREKREAGIRRTSSRNIECPFSFNAVAKVDRSFEGGNAYTVWVSVSCSQHTHEISRWAMLSLAEYRVVRDLDDVKHSMFIQGKNEMPRQA